MTDRPFEDLVAAWYRSRVDAEPVPDRLRDRVLAVPDRVQPGRWWPARPDWTLSRRAIVAILLATALLGLALGASAGVIQRLRLDRAVPFRADLDACEVLRAAMGEDLPDAFTGYRADDHGMTSWGAHVCAGDYWDSGYNYRHLLLRIQPTTLAEAAAIIDDPANWSELDREDGDPALPAVWRPHSPGVWAGGPAADASYRDTGMVVLAVSREPYFFIVTGSAPSKVIDVAGRVADELGVPFGDVASYEWPPIVQPVPTMWRPS